MSSLMKRKVLFLLIALLASGCATAKPFLKDVSPQERIQDQANCQNQAEMVQIASFEYRGTFMEGADIKNKQNKVFSNCMIGKGYHR
jgi:starvation-inducible outer membrane lipoprotein